MIQIVRKKIVNQFLRKNMTQNHKNNHANKNLGNQILNQNLVKKNQNPRNPTRRIVKKNQRNL